MPLILPAFHLSNGNKVVETPLVMLQNDHIWKLVTVWIPGPVVLATIIYVTGLAGLQRSIEAAGGVIIGATIATVLLILYDKWSETKQDKRKKRVRKKQERKNR